MKYKLKKGLIKMKFSRVLFLLVIVCSLFCFSGNSYAVLATPSSASVTDASMSVAITTTITEATGTTVSSELICPATFYTSDRRHLVISIIASATSITGLNAPTLPKAAGSLDYLAGGGDSKIILYGAAGLTQTASQFTKISTIYNYGLHEFDVESFRICRLEIVPATTTEATSEYSIYIYKHGDPAYTIQNPGPGPPF